MILSEERRRQFAPVSVFLRFVDADRLLDDRFVPRKLAVPGAELVLDEQCTVVGGTAIFVVKSQTYGAC
jgi:hypothetical protein